MRRGVICSRGTTTCQDPSPDTVTGCWIRRPDAMNSAHGSATSVPNTRKATERPACERSTLRISAPGRAAEVTTRAFPVTVRPIR